MARGTTFNGGDVPGEGAISGDDNLADAIFLVTPNLGYVLSILIWVTPNKAVPGADADLDRMAVGSDGPKARAWHGDELAGAVGWHGGVPGGWRPGVGCL